MAERESPGLREITAASSPSNQGPRGTRHTLSNLSSFRAGETQVQAAVGWAQETPQAVPRQPAQSQPSLLARAVEPRLGCFGRQQNYGLQPVHQNCVCGTLKVPFIFISLKALSSRIFAFLARWMGWVISAAHLEPGASPTEDLNQNKEKAKDHIWSHKTPIRTLRITRRKTFYMNWTQIHKSKRVHSSPP